MKAASGAQVFASAADAMVLESGKKGFHPIGDYKPVKVDRIIKDKDNVKLGSGHSPHLTPGHTEGNTTWTTTIENGKKLNVVFAGEHVDQPGSAHDQQPDVGWYSRGIREFVCDAEVTPM